MRSDCSDIGHLLVYGQRSLFYFRRQEPAADAWTGSQYRRAWRRLWRRWSPRAPFLRQPRIVRRVTEHGTAPFGQPMLGDYFDIAVNLNAATGHRLPHQHGLAGEAERFVGDGRHTPPLLFQIAYVHKILQVEHWAPWSAQRFHTWGFFDRRYWGIFNRRFWGIL